MLITETYFRIERDEDNKRNREFERLHTMAMRWHAEPDGTPDEQEEYDKGVSTLRALSTSNAVSEQQLQRALRYLDASIAWYEAGPWDGVEPFEGRNAEAAQDLRNLREVLSIEIIVCDA